ncbi:hypothetical protein [Flavobacterium sp. N2820]|uniref:hypothetical protein n=1 Tax=Flavobacterium sp. N2820 TaxID=2986834 RepID=UPI00222516E8|nr:hypothetical protein [Flavobacterium sp. N2820]
MTKIAIIGSCSHEIVLAIQKVASLQNLEKVVIIEDQQTKNIAFEPEPFPIKNYRGNLVEMTTYYEQKPSKFFTKPKKNFKK